MLFYNLGELYCVCFHAFLTTSLRSFSLTGSLSCLFSPLLYDRRMPITVLTTRVVFLKVRHIIALFHWYVSVCIHYPGGWGEVDLGFPFYCDLVHSRLSGLPSSHHVLRKRSSCFFNTPDKLHAQCGAVAEHAACWSGSGTVNILAHVR